jgi:hypothetical protein
LFGLLNIVQQTLEIAFRIEIEDFLLPVGFHFFMVPVPAQLFKLKLDNKYLIYIKPYPSAD